MSADADNLATLGTDSLIYVPDDEVLVGTGPPAAPPVRSGQLYLNIEGLTPPVPSEYYTKTETDALLAEKADASSVYTKGEVDALVPVMAVGQIATPAVPANSSDRVAVTFPAGLFSAPPVVTVSTDSGRHNTAVANLTATGFEFVVDNFTTGNASAGTGHWIAVENPA